VDGETHLPLHDVAKDGTRMTMPWACAARARRNVQFDEHSFEPFEGARQWVSRQFGGRPWRGCLRVDAHWQQRGCRDSKECPTVLNSHDFSLVPPKPRGEGGLSTRGEDPGPLMELRPGEPELRNENHLLQLYPLQRPFEALAIRVPCRAGFQIDQGTGVVIRRPKRERLASGARIECRRRI